MNYISKDKPQFKANLHCHTNLSDGVLTPVQVAEAYRQYGYSVLAITDHEAPYDHTDLTGPDFLILTGYEAYIRPSRTCVYDPFAPEIHMNLLAKEPHNTTIIGYDPLFCKYMSTELAETRKKAANAGPRRYDHEYIQTFIDTAVENGYLVTYNHPCWSMEGEDMVLDLGGLFSLEIFNTNSMNTNGYEHNISLYDKFLRRGKFIGCHGADDNHNKRPFDDLLSDSFGSWTMILAEELTYPAVIEALEKGNFYASTGPEIRELTFEGKHVHLECSPAQRIIMHITPKLTKNVYHSDGSPVTEADFEIPEKADFVYFSVLEANGKAAYTRAFRREELV